MRSDEPPQPQTARRRPAPQRRKRRRRRAPAAAHVRSTAAGSAPSRPSGCCGAPGFGPRPGEAEKLAQKGLERAVHSLTRPAEGAAQRPAAARRATATRWRRPTPGGTTTCGGSTGWSAPTGPLIERMTLVWHDWFATSNDGVGSQRLMIHQNELLPQARARLVREPAGAASRATRRCCSGSRASRTRRTRRTRTTAAS